MSGKWRRIRAFFPGEFKVDPFAGAPGPEQVGPKLTAEGFGAKASPAFEEGE